MDEDEKVVGVESGQGRPLEVYGDVRGGDREIRGGRVSVGRKSSGRVCIRLVLVGVSEGVVNNVPPSLCPVIVCLRVLGGVVGVEVTHVEGIIQGLEESVKGWRIDGGQEKVGGL